VPALDPSAIVDALFASTTVGVALLDRELRYVRVNEALAAINLASAAEHIGRTSAELAPWRQPAVMEFQRQVLDTGEPVVDLAVIDSAESANWPTDRTFRASYFPIRGSDDNDGDTVLGILVIGTESTALVAAKEAARHRDELFHRVAENIDSLLWLSTPDNRLLYVSPAASTLWGIDPQVLLRGDELFRDYVHPDDRETAYAAFDRLADGYEVEFRIVLRDGRIRWVREHAFPICETDGTVYQVAGFSTDITDRRELESRLIQAQRLESLGQLAGGIAHDFNNYLTAMNGFGQLALMRAGRGEVPTSEIREVLAAGQRAAQLTSQLLAFGRARPQHVERLDLNGVIGLLEGLIRRVSGEDVELALELDPDIGLVQADPGQLEQVVMNLAVNARDAMPGGGTLTIATRPFDDAGRQFVELAVTDIGSGMSRETAAHAFEPFFTTKEPGVGTGLGLAVVYGVAHSLDGDVSIESEEGAGTTVAVRLPAIPRSEDPESDDEAAPGMSSGSETVLVVEDEDAVRALVRQVLEARGYRVLDARSGEDALELIEQEPARIDLLLTDVVMSHMSGPQLAAQVLGQRSDVRVLYTSGHSDRGRAAHQLRPDDELLDKPFTPDELARRVRATLDATNPER
jgi:PAS domain S-box-containing protein